MRLVIVVTVPDSPLWEAIEGWPKDEKFDNTAVHIADAGPDRIAIVRQAQSKKRKDEEVFIDSRMLTTSLVINLSNVAEYKDSRIYVASHAYYVDFDEVRRNVPDRRFQAGADFSHQSEKTKTLFDDLMKLLGKVDPHSFEAVVESIIKYQVASYEQRLSTLKHRLLNVFLPVSVDLLGWRKAGFDDAYLEDIYKTYKSDDGRLDRGRSLLYLESASADSVERVLDQSGLIDDDSWEALRTLFPSASEEAEAGAEQRYPTYFAAREALSRLTTRNGLSQLRQTLAQKNEFSEWCEQLRRHMSDLVGKVHY